MNKVKNNYNPFLSMNNIDNITLSCLMNKDQFENINRKNTLINDLTFKKEKHFYKKRIIDLTKKLFKSNIDDKELNNCFQLYTKSCINYLKFIDKQDIIQEKYETLNYNNAEQEINNNTEQEMNNNTEQEINNHAEQEINNKLIMANKETKHINLDNYIVKKKNVKEKKILPQKEEIDITGKKFKTKGIKNKKIKDKYIEIKNENQEK